ncbi:hypothetical protein QDR37_00310 [Amnibacterium sp. CER49]|uniref:hypothetical protein n=1 Tax=Amnibacterium sp. CER49 TaxID=3039161 RepID=UPI00244AEDF8|nr:hypothetical protein [Amnibacterium sp. CER49]MDH2442381.1 hypothetical protein [Amnibacterium sp. CER49]
MAGATWEQVAKFVGFSDASTAQRAVRNFFGETPQQDREELRHLLRQRGEVLWRQARRDMLESRPGAGFRE